MIRPTECECGRVFPTWRDWQMHSQRPSGYDPHGPDLHRRIFRPACQHEWAEETTPHEGDQP